MQRNRGAATDHFADRISRPLQHPRLHAQVERDRRRIAKWSAPAASAPSPAVRLPSGTRKSTRSVRPRTPTIPTPSFDSSSRPTKSRSRLRPAGLAPKPGAPLDGAPTSNTAGQSRIGESRSSCRKGSKAWSFCYRQPDSIKSRSEFSGPKGRIARGVLLLLAWFSGVSSSRTPRRLVMNPDDPFPEPVRIPIEDVLDLHTVSPRDVKAVVEEYLAEANRLGFKALRIIHGRGIGVQREFVRTYWPIPHSYLLMPMLRRKPEAGEPPS